MRRPRLPPSLPLFALFSFSTRNTPPRLPRRLRSPVRDSNLSDALLTAQFTVLFLTWPLRTPSSFLLFRKQVRGKLTAASLTRFSAGSMNLPAGARDYFEKRDFCIDTEEQTKGPIVVLEGLLFIQIFRLFRQSIYPSGLRMEDITRGYFSCFLVSTCYLREGCL